MRAIAIILLAVVVCILLVCAARLLGTGFAETQQQQFEEELRREAAENIEKAYQVREMEKQRRATP
jgi:predicted Holliday junction resolvase-like endonuclease